MNIEVKCVVNSLWTENCYIVSQGKDAVIIDPGGSENVVSDYINEHRLEVHAIINTHAHFDHIGAVDVLKKKYECPFYLHPGDTRLLRTANLYITLFAGEKPVVIPVVDHWFDKERLPLVFGSLKMEVIHTPGHTEGSVCFRTGNHLFTGDTLMAGSIGRVDLPGGNKQKLIASLRDLAALPEKLIIYPGHGPASTIETELLNNEALKAAIS